MHKIQTTIEVKAPAQRAYDFINQPKNLLSIWPSLIEVSNVLPRAGSYDFDWVYRMAGVPLKGHTRVEEAAPGRLLRTRTEGAIQSAFRWTFQGLDGAGTKVRGRAEIMEVGQSGMEIVRARLALSEHAECGRAGEATVRTIAAGS